MRLPGLLGGMKTDELGGGGPLLAYGIRPCETWELRPGGGRDILNPGKSVDFQQTSWTVVVTGRSAQTLM